MTQRREEAQVERLVRENWRLVEHIVDRYTRKYHVGTMEREDLVSWGLIGLYQAARAWDESRSLQFSTLAWKAIQRSIYRGVQREWDADEARATVSLDERVRTSDPDADQGTSLGQLLPDPRAEAETRALETRVAVRNAVMRLPARDRALIQERFYEERSCAELGAREGKCRQAIYLREQSILRRLGRDLTREFAEASTR